MANENSKDRETLPKGELDKLWSWALHEDTLFSNRSSLLLALQALLLTASSLDGSNTKVLATIGLFISVLTIYLYWYQTTQRLEPIKNLLDENISFYQSIRKHKLKVPGANKILGIYLPIILAIVWVIPFFNG